MSPYMGMFSILKFCETETVIGIACNDANTGRQYVCSSNYNRGLESSSDKSDVCYT